VTDNGHDEDAQFAAFMRRQFGVDVPVASSLEPRAPEADGHPNSHPGPRAPAPDPEDEAVSEAIRRLFGRR
jgi:hypothetical protein